MEKALNFLKNHKNAAFATVEGGRPKIRTFQIMKQEGADLYFVTGYQKEVYRQLRSNPAVEILVMDGNEFVRVAGDAVFDVDDETAREIYATTPVLQRLYDDYTKLAYFRLPIAVMDYYDLTPTPPVQEHHELSKN